MEQITYSFIIPHHNTPDLLQRLLNSIPQRKDIEIIVVDDNSDLANKPIISRPDINIIFIDKEHSKGAGHARNVGMEAANGRWLLFADSDDFYKPGFIEVLDEYKDEDLEILFFNVESVDSDTLEYGHDRTSLEQKIVTQFDGSKKAANELLFLRWGPWRKMLSRIFIKKYSFFYEEIPNGNDVLFSLLTSYFAKKWKVDKRILYVLTYRQGSITYNKLSSQKYSTTLKNIRRRTAFFKFIGCSEWISPWKRNALLTSIPRYLYSKFRLSPIKGMEIFLYYLSHIVSIEKGANYYVDVVKEIEKKYNNE